MVQSFDGKNRCFGNKENQAYYAAYHDLEWGIPEHDDQKLFEKLSLEGAQAGLSWETILKKRDGYRRCFLDFNVKKVAKMTDTQLMALKDDASIVRNRLKIFSVRKNAQVFIELQKEFGSFDQYLWNYVDHKPIKNSWKDFTEVPVSTPISEALSKDLKKRGMSFVGPTIIYAFMQAVGMVDDHLQTCWKYHKNKK